MCENEWITAPSSIADAGAEHHERLDRHVAAECWCRSTRYTVSGAISVTPACHRRLAQPRLHHRFGFGELRLGVDAAHFVLAGFDHAGRSPIARTMPTASVR